jgi:hypothetical protein
MPATTPAYGDYPVGVMSGAGNDAIVESDGRGKRGGAGMPTKLFEIRVRGTVPQEVLDDAGDLHAVVEAPQTVLRGTVRDQAALQGLLQQLHSLGLELVEVRRLSPLPDDPAERPAPA